VRWTIPALLVLGVLLAGTARADEDKGTSLAAAREAAESNAKTPAGRRYGTAFEASLDRWLPETLRRCVKGRSAAELGSFDAFVRIGGDGEAEDVLFSDDTPVGRCAEGAFRSAEYPKPPRPSWWTKVEVRLK
jgi:hypothetical protein